MKIDNISLIYDRSVQGQTGTVRGKEYSGTNKTDQSKEVFSKEEAKFFKNIFPGVDVEQHVKKSYDARGKSEVGGLGRVVDKKG